MYTLAYSLTQAHVYSEDEEVWDAMLNQTNLKNNNNKFYILQLLKDNTAARYSTWFRWGRGTELPNTVLSCLYMHIVIALTTCIHIQIHVSVSLCVIYTLCIHIHCTCRIHVYYVCIACKETYELCIVREIIAY